MAATGSEKPTVNEPNVEELELKALQERNQIHQSVEVLRSEVENVRRNLDPERIARKYFLGASIVASAVGYLAGFRFSGLFID
jgi:hypothetical protein